MYYVRYEQGKKQAHYCGPVGETNTNTERKALQFELEEIHIKKAELEERAGKINEKLATYK